jgi:two-component sensor histidine kinase
VSNRLEHTGLAIEAVKVALWQPARLPHGFRELWCQQLQSLGELAKLRTRLRSELTGRATVERPEDEHWAERLVLVSDELASNALRHGHPPVAASLQRAGDEWMIAVTDSSTEVPPTPAEGRDPGQGGFGLYLVADLAVRHGWFRRPGEKTVWAIVTAHG